MGNLAVAGQRLTAAFLNQYYGQADTAAQTVTAATQQPLTTSYSIPANEPVVGSAYPLAYGDPPSSCSRSRSSSRAS